MSAKRIRHVLLVIFIYILCLAYFFPILYMILTSFKPETQVIPPRFIFTPTLENYRQVLNPDILNYLKNSALVSVITTIACIVVGIPASYAIVFGKLKKPDNLFFWFLSTTLLPPVSVVIPVYLIARYTHLLDTRFFLVLMYSGANIPIVIWMVRSFLKDVPREILEAATIDGCSRVRSFFRIIVPLTQIGITSTALLVFIFVWNEFFFAINLTYVHAATIPVYMASYMTQEGLFWAKLSAISTVTVLPPLVLGWIAHKSLVRGLTLGAVKG